jgi:hypothetical protein
MHRQDYKFADVFGGIENGEEGWIWDGGSSRATNELKKWSQKSQQLTNSPS